MEPGDAYRAQSGREYHLLEKIAAAGDANVFTARSLNEIGRPIRVMKRFRNRGGLGEIRLKREREILTHLNQANSGEDYQGVIKLYDYSEEKLFLILEYMRGGDLGDSISYTGTGNFHLAEAMTILRQLSGTLAKMFRNEGIVHRDVKSENILLSESSSKYLRDNEEQNRSLKELAQLEGIKFCDFSLALIYNKSTGEYESKVHDRKISGYFIGTLKYCAPEITEENRGDERSDVWSLGVIAYDLLIPGGAFPGAKSPKQMFQKLITFVRAREIKRDLHGFEEVMYSMMQRNPKDRITAEEIHGIASELEGKLKDIELPKPKSKIKNLIGRILGLS